MSLFPHEIRNHFRHEMMYLVKNTIRFSKITRFWISGQYLFAIDYLLDLVIWWLVLTSSCNFHMHEHDWRKILKSRKYFNSSNFSQVIGKILLLKLEHTLAHLIGKLFCRSTFLRITVLVNTESNAKTSEMCDSQLPFFTHVNILLSSLWKSYPVFELLLQFI